MGETEARSHLPLPSLEVRWFFNEPIDRHPELLDWFMGCAPVARNAELDAPHWQERRHDQPDLYLLLAESEDMGIKWREGALQIKGRLANLGAQVLAGRHCGQLERWVKWSYPDLPEGNRWPLAHEAATVIPVHKTRLLRKVALSTFTGQALEVAPAAPIDRGVMIEITAIRVGDAEYCSLAFEAFPDDSGLNTAFGRVLQAFLGELTTRELRLSESFGYPAWLTRLSEVSDLGIAQSGQHD